MARTIEEIRVLVKAEDEGASPEFLEAIALLAWCAEQDTECFDSDHSETELPIWEEEGTLHGKAKSYLNEFQTF